MKKVFTLLALMLLLLPCWPASAEVVDGIVYGETTETGTGVKGPYNPYTITGYLPEQVTVGDTIYGMPEGMAPLYSLPDGTRDEYNPVTGVETRRVGVRPLSTKDWLSYSGVCCQYLTNDNVKVGPFLSTHFIYVEDGTQSIQYGQCTIDARTGTIRWRFYIDEYYSYMPFFLGDYGDVYVYYAMQEPSTTQHTPVIIGTATTAPTTTTTTSGGGTTGSTVPPVADDFITSMSHTSGFFATIFGGLWDTIKPYAWVMVIVIIPFAFYLLTSLIVLLQTPVHDSASLSDQGLVGFFKRHRLRQEEREKERFAKRVLSQAENIDAAYVKIDGKKYYRNNTKRRHEVQLGGSLKDQYYRMNGSYVPVKGSRDKKVHRKEVKKDD